MLFPICFIVAAFLSITDGILCLLFYLTVVPYLLLVAVCLPLVVVYLPLVAVYCLIVAAFLSITTVQR